MSNETLFYVFGIALVLMALGTSAVGIKREGFPGKTGFRVVALLFAALVAVTATFAVLNAQDEVKARHAEKAQEAGGEQPR